jgi:PIN domain nuclease of toxin-antitoxin system
MPDAARPRCDVSHNHRNLFDRLLAAQAITEPTISVTADPLLRRHTEPVMLAG